MQIAAQVRMAPADPRACRGHHGNHFVAVSTGNGRCVYYWLSLPQAWFWRSMKPSEKARFAGRLAAGCFVCALQKALEEEAIYGAEFPVERRRI